MFEKVVHPNQDGLTVEEFLMGEHNLSRNFLRRLKTGGGIYVNGLRAFMKDRVLTNDIVTVFYPETESAVAPESIPVDIAWEDEGLLVVNKPAGQPVYPTKTYPQGTLVNALASLWKHRNIAGKIRIVQRLDRNTSGLLLVAKNPYAAQTIQAQQLNGDLEKEYLAIAAGSVFPQQGVIDQPLGLANSPDEHGLKRCVMPNGKPAVTEYQVLRRAETYSLLRLKLITGRTHQIRAHLAWMGYPILGDEMYGELSSLIKRQALHAWRLKFWSAKHNQVITVRAPIPHDMKRIL